LRSSTTKETRDPTATSADDVTTFTAERPKGDTPCPHSLTTAPTKWIAKARAEASMLDFAQSGTRSPTLPRMEKWVSALLPRFFALVHAA
jgi:hypothetical protein